MARQYINHSKIIGMISCASLVIAVISLLAFRAYRIVKIPVNKIGIACIGTFSTAGFWDATQAILLAYVTIGIPTFLTFILMLFLFVRLRQVTSSRTIEQTGRHVENSRSNIETILVLFTISLAQVILYSPFALSWTLVTGLGGILSPDLNNLLAIVRRLLIDIITLVHVWNLYIYLAISPLFRAEFVRVILCRP